MQELLEDFSSWSMEALTQVPPESLEAADLIVLVIELQDRIKSYIELDPFKTRD